MQQKFLEKTLGQQIADMAAKYPDDNMIDYTDRDYSRTWKEFNDECETIARGFMALGLKKGSHISIWGTNVPAWLLTFFGSAKMAACPCQNCFSGPAVYNNASQGKCFTKC